MLRQYLQGRRVAGDKLRPQFLPSSLPDREGGNRTLSLDPEGAGCQLPTSLCHLYTYSETIAFQGTRYVLWGGRELFPSSSGPEGLGKGLESHSKSAAKAEI